MTWIQRFLFFIAVAATAVSADRVLLVDGQVFEGRILSETQYEVEIETSRNEARTIRTIQIINREAVKSLARGGEAVVVLPDAPSSQEGQAEPDPEVLDITAAHNWLESSTGLLEAGKYDEALDRFERIANDPRLVAQSRRQTAEARPALDLRVRTYKLWMTAVKGKREFLEAEADEYEDAAEQRLDRAEDRLKEYQKEQKDSKDKREVIQLRSRQREAAGLQEEDFRDVVREARKNQAEFERWDRKNTLMIQNLESEYDLLREQLKQIERELKALLKML